ncbi:hypothetical protein F511_28007 [Dorcoceras hygrometricum]|uniref:Uncharacterized protein n=1 Tax=Dorcoceras hygrometricum TaxID=472368 RepID=A0A2Z7BJM5_9LAMI|nr:hypothetical protein F511_28007 [Dorcoceras hygrometricum]
MMNSRRICPADGSQYKDSAVGLVFMESAAELAMETSKVESAVRNQAEANLNQLEHSPRPDTRLLRQPTLEGLTRSARTGSRTKDSADAICVDNQSQDPVASYSGSSRKLYESSRKLCVSNRHGIQSQESRCSGELQSRRKIPVAVFEDSAEAQSSSRLESAAKQLTIYESWMSTAELYSNGKNAQDGKNQWLILSRANCLNSREQDLYYSGK